LASRLPNRSPQIRPFPCFVVTAFSVIFSFLGKKLLRQKKIMTKHRQYHSRFSVKQPVNAIQLFQGFVVLDKSIA